MEGIQNLKDMLKDDLKTFCRVHCPYKVYRFGASAEVCCYCHIYELKDKINTQLNNFQASNEKYY